MLTSLWWLQEKTCHPSLDGQIIHLSSKKIPKIRPLLSIFTILVHANIVSSLDVCICLFSGFPSLFYSLFSRVKRGVILKYNSHHVTTLLKTLLRPPISLSNSQSPSNGQQGPIQFALSYPSVLSSYFCPPSSLSLASLHFHKYAKLAPAS